LTQGEEQIIPVWYTGLQKVAGGCCETEVTAGKQKVVVMPRPSSKLRSK
jgi:hypothetical protein